MIICISGPSSTGKTTLLDSLSEHKELISAIFGIDSDKVVFRAEGIRGFLSEHYPGRDFNDIIENPESAINLQCQLAELDYKNYTEMIKNQNTLYICDRSPLDTMIYNLMNYHCDNPEVMKAWADKVSVACSTLRSLYSQIDRVYYVSADRENKYGVMEDGFRPKKYEFRRQLEIEMFSSVFYNDNKVIQLPSLTTDRTNMIIKDMRNYKNWRD